jgi:hypothetical protein
MRHVKLLSSVVFATMMFVGSEAAAQTWNRTTSLTFSTAVELPGITLPAGTYTFRLGDSMSDRHIVQVLDKDGMKLHTTILAIPARRNIVTDETVVTFHELPAEMTPAVRFWYYPGDQSGQEFAYPKAQAVRIAAASRAAVLSVDGDAIARVEPEATAAVAVPAQPETPQVETPTPQPAPQIDTQARAETQVAGTSGRQRLPATASSLPLAGLIGLLSLGGAIVTRAIRARA